jgi:CheY-like chemotaxis protein
MLRRKPAWQALPVIAMTANAMDGGRDKALDAGMNDHPPDADLCLGHEGHGVRLHEAGQRGLFRAVALVVHLGAIGRPLGLPADGLHARRPKW